MFHGIWKQVGIIVVLAGMPIILLSLLFVGVLFGALFSSLSLPR
jgi:hypothetical protein